MSAYPLDPNLAAYVAHSATFTPENDSLAARRAAFARACRHFTPQQPANIWVEDEHLDGLAVRLYTPLQPAPANGWPTLLYLHGGGWNMGSHTTHDWFAFALLKRLPVAIVAVDYRLAPEHPFPAPLEDALTVWHALRRRHWPQWDSERLLVAGDSAGGSIAAGLCVALRQLGLPQPLLQALAYPVLTADETLESMQTHAHAPMLSTAGLRASLAGHLPDAEQRTDPRALALAIDDATGLAPAFIGVAEYDPLFDQGRQYAQALQRAGVSVQLHIGRGLVHASLRAAGVAAVEQFYDALAEALGKALAL
ncbi:alpha/beta hydrolase [Pseudomonas sp. RHF3.3-3]|uniref:alpha/beta hydrolase n=1 Tax=Pseudomonas sp. RHF3.3-3 TaxID=3396624 RepID=UPI003A841F7D